MKKVLSLFMALIFVVVGGVMFSACGDDNKITSTYLQYSEEGVTFEQISSNDKTEEYKLTTDYGTQIDVDDIDFYWSNKHGESFEVNKKTDTTDGYTLESDLPAAQNVGNYTLTFSYNGWTNVVKVVINKKEVDLPTWKSGVVPYYDGVMYTGEDYTQKIDYDSEELEMLEPNVKRIEPKEYDASGSNADAYNVKFRLKDDANYKWPENCELDEENNHIFSFKIEKVLFQVDINNYVKENEHRVPQSDPRITPAFTYNSATPSISDIINANVINDFKDEVIVQIFKSGVEDNKIADNMNEKGYYSIVVAVKDPNHNSIIKTTELNNPQAFIGNPDSYVCVATIAVE